MSEPGRAVSAEDLRRAFDESFALAPGEQAGDVLDYLAIRAGNGRYALPVRDLAGLEGRREIVPLPSADPALLGIAGAQGRLVPVYRLALLLGAGGGEEEPNWLAVCGREEPVALAFATLETHLRVAAADVHRLAKDNHAYVREAIRLDWEVRYVLDIPALLAAIRDRAGVAAPASGR